MGSRKAITGLACSDFLEGGGEVALPAPPGLEVGEGGCKLGTSCFA